MAEAHTHLHFDGCCLEALKFYEQTFGGKITLALTWGESPAAKDVSPDWSRKILHSSLEFEGQTLSADDAPPGHYSKPQGFEVLVTYTDPKKAKRVFEALADGGEVKMAFTKTFWSEGFGMAVDRFGTPWMINTGAENT